MTNIIIPFAETGSKIPLIEFEIDEKWYMGLLDTGSESTLFDLNIPKSEYFEKKETDYEMSLVGLSGETSRSKIIEVTALIDVNDIYENVWTVPVNGILSDLSNVSQGINERYGQHLNVAAVFGSDMLKSVGAKIDYRRQQLTIRR